MPDLETLAQWFKHCERDGELLGLEHIVRNGTRLNHCAAAQCAAAVECAYDDDVIPHRPRAAAKELMADAIDAGVWHDIAEVRAEEWLPRSGDLIVYDRYDPSNPKSEPWHGHTDRIVSVVSEHRLETIGANEVDGRWRQEIEDINAPACKALGIVAYPVEEQDDKPRLWLSEGEVARLKNLSKVTTEVAAYDYWAQWHRKV